MTGSSSSEVGGLARRIRAIVAAISPQVVDPHRELVGGVHAELGGQLVEPVGQGAHLAP